MNKLAETFFEDLHNGKYSFLTEKNEPRKNRRLYNLFVTVMDNLDKETLRIYTTNSTKEIIEKYKLEGIRVKTIQERNFDIQRLFIIKTNEFTENLNLFYINSRIG